MSEENAVWLKDHFFNITKAYKQTYISKLCWNSCVMLTNSNLIFSNIWDKKYQDKKNIFANHDVRYRSNDIIKKKHWKKIAFSLHKKKVISTSGFRFREKRQRKFVYVCSKHKSRVEDKFQPPFGIHIMLRPVRLSIEKVTE